MNDMKAVVVIGSGKIEEMITDLLLGSADYIITLADSKQK